MMPFAGGPESLSNGTLLLSAVAAFLYLLMLHRPPSWRRTVVKTGSVALLAVLAQVEGGPLLLVAALALSAIGDAFLAQDGEKAFLGGLASFLVAHLAYVALFAASRRGDGNPRRAAMAAGIAGGRSPWPLCRCCAGCCPRRDRICALPVAAYAAAILAMMWSSATVAAPLVMVGAAMFVVSDAILATAKFLFAPVSRHHAWAAPSVWMLYYLAQVAITLAFIL
ncbi:MAG: lysoplasmalogenase [Mesorhizobium sp.]|nr:lysoplasmalogenase [Mesorhizobium sp.]